MARRRSKLVPTPSQEAPMATTAAALTPSGKTNAERMFPTLTPAQVARVAEHGRRRATQRGDVLFEAGDAVPRFYVVTEGRVEVVRPAESGDTLVTVHGPGQF